MIKAAVIGAGYIAREHLDALRNLPNVEISSICDLSPAMAEAAAEEFSATAWHTDHRRMLAEVRPQVVHVTTPPKSHVPLALDALEAGAHALVEKPIAASLGDLERLTRCARERDRLLIEDYNYLFNPSVQRILELVESGEFGEVVHVDALFCVNILGPGSKHSDPNAPGPFDEFAAGPVADFVTHLAYLSNAFVGEHRKVDSAWIDRSGDPGAPFDELRALITAERGTACVGFSSHAQPDVFSLRVHGTRMRATASLFEPLLVLERLRGGPRPLLPVRNGFGAAAAHVSSAASGLWRKLQGRPGTYQGLRTLVTKVYRSVEHRSDPPIPLDRVEAVNALVHAMLAGAEGS